MNDLLYTYKKELYKPVYHLYRGFVKFRKENLGLRHAALPPWTLYTLDHPKQLDSISCGVFVIKVCAYLYTGAVIFNNRHRPFHSKKGLSCQTL